MLKYKHVGNVKYMTNEELKDQLEKRLSKTMKKRRIIEGLICVIFLVIGIVCSILREASREVIVHGEGFLWFEEINYNDNYIAGIVIGFFVSFVLAMFFLSDLLASGFATTKANGHFITVYRGMKSNYVYINGDEKGKIGPFSFTYVVETKLPDGVKVIVSFSKRILTYAHISYSDNNPSIDI